EESHFTSDGRRRAYRILVDVLAAQPGRPADLSVVAEQDFEMGERLRRLTLDDTPEESPDGVYRRLELGRVEREIDEVKSELERLTPADAAYDTLSRRLVELLRERAGWRS